VEPWSHGSVLRSPLAPDWWDANLVRVEGPDAGLSAAELIASADDLQADLQHRRVVVEDTAAAVRLLWTPHATGNQKSETTSKASLKSAPLMRSSASFISCSQRCLRKASVSI